MELYPALDLLNAQCVRLKNGIFENKTVYSSHPAQVISAIEKAGARNLHLVDLNGAKDPALRQYDLIRQLVEGSQLRIQCGGGIRSMTDVQKLLQVGVDRVVLGSIAVQDPTLTCHILKEFGPDRITLGMDVLPQPDGSFEIASQGWLKTQDCIIENWLQAYLEVGLKRVLCTDIRRDGMMTGPNFSLYDKLISLFPQIEFQASGGVSDLEDLRKLNKSGLHSAIIGKAIYEGQISLSEAIQQC